MIATSMHKLWPQYGGALSKTPYLQLSTGSTQEHLSLQDLKKC